MHRSQTLHATYEACEGRPTILTVEAATIALDQITAVLPLVLTCDHEGVAQEPAAARVADVHLGVAHALHQVQGRRRHGRRVGLADPVAAVAQIQRLSVGARQSAGDCMSMLATCTGVASLDSR